MIRAHMPGHKGKPFLGCEALDITEIRGADSLYEADGMILYSESHAGELFGSGRTVYSTEGSSQCIRAMLSGTDLRKRIPDGGGRSERTPLVRIRGGSAGF